MTLKETRAFAQLLELLGAGYEYPDAEWAATGRGKLCSTDRLRELYDAYCAA